MGMIPDSAFKGASKAPPSAHTGAAPVPLAAQRREKTTSAPRGAAVWRPKLKGQPPEDEIRRRFMAFTEAEREQFPQLPIIRVPCCYTVHPAGWCQCLFCGALLQYKGNVVPFGTNGGDSSGRGPIHRPCGVGRQGGGNGRENALQDPEG